MLGPQKPMLRVGGGELLCYMERLSPLSENKDPPWGMPPSELCSSSSTDRASAHGGQVALFGVTDIAPRRSGTLQMTLSQPGQADRMGLPCSLMAVDLPSLFWTLLTWARSRPQGEGRGGVCISISSLVIRQKMTMQERGCIQKNVCMCRDIRDN